MFSLKIKKQPFDLQTALNTWSTSAPQHPVSKFRGKPKRTDDPAVNAWLALVKKGCTARRVPKGYWPAVALHFMGKKARRRMEEVERVMRVLHGDVWAWTWKQFSAVAGKMGWNKDDSEKRQVRVERQASGLWRLIPGGGAGDPPTPTTKAKPMTPSHTGSASSSKISFLRSKHTPTEVAKDSSKKGTSNLKDSSTKGKVRPTRPSASSRHGSLFTLPEFLCPSTPTPEPEPRRTPLARIAAWVPEWLLDAVDEIARVADENPDVLKAIATMLFSMGGMAVGLTSPIAVVVAVVEAATALGRALKSPQDADGET